MTLAEFTCLVRLFQACADPALRRRAVELVPELREWDEPSTLTAETISHEFAETWDQINKIWKPRLRVIDE